MNELNRLHPEQKNQEVIDLEIEIAGLENRISRIEEELSDFEDRIRFHLQDQLVLLHELTQLYKDQKKAKKQKRKEQRQRGKNYIPPTGLKLSKSDDTQEEILSKDKGELKRLYKEAIVHVHPDKFAQKEEQGNRATEITVQLNHLYQTGKLEELKDIHQHIVSGNAMEYQPSRPQSVKDETALVDHLKQKLQQLKDQLESRQQSHTYQVLKTYENPTVYIDELREYVKDKIKKMKRRTRTK